MEARLRRRFRVTESSVTFGKWRCDLLHPASPEELIDVEAFERDERLPYWADLWPSSHILAAELLARAGPDGTALLELGCGIGLVATASAHAGYQVTASDYYADALDFTRVNVARNGGSVADARLLDWRDLPSDLGRFDTVVASDVLYERPYGPLVAQVIARTLAPGGSAIVADPGRVGRESFIEESDRLGLTVASTPRHFAEGQIRQTVALLELAWKR